MWCLSLKVSQVVASGSTFDCASTCSELRFALPSGYGQVMSSRRLRGDV